VRAWGQAVFKLLFIIRQLIRFSREARGFLGESEQLLEQHDPDEAAALRSSYRRILLFAVVFPILCGLIVPIVVPCIVFLRGEFADGALAMALFLGLLFSLVASFFYLFAGVAVGCMLAPDEFMDSPVGEQWLALIGTKNHTAARVVCFVMAVAGLAIMAGICAVELWMLHAPGLNK
jgi:hypothetical protein